MARSQRWQERAHRRRPEDLTPREKEILTLIWTGLTNRQIAERLGISLKTVESHRATIMTKARARNAAELLKVALAQGLIDTH
ncbi:response regulator transcription factor [Nitrospira sp. Nam74]